MTIDVYGELARTDAPGRGFKEFNEFSEADALAADATPEEDEQPDEGWTPELRTDGDLESVFPKSAERDRSFRVEKSEVEKSEGVQPFPVVRVLAGEPPDPPAVHVANLIADRDLNVWMGRGGSAKTVLLLTASVCTVIARPVFGSLAVTRPGPVLLVLPEDGVAAARMMLDAIIEGMALSPNDRAAVAEGLVQISDEAVVDITKDARRLRQTAVDAEAVMVVFDPLRNLLGGAAENENDVAVMCYQTLRRELCWSNASATVLFNHHTRKPGNQPGNQSDAESKQNVSVNDARGAGAWTDGARLVFGVAKRENRIEMIGVKSNRLRADIRHDLDLAIEADPANAAHWLTCRVTDANVGANGANSMTYTVGLARAVNENERRALKAVHNPHEPGSRVSWSMWEKTSDLKTNTLKSIKERLFEAKLIERHLIGTRENGQKTYNYSITDAGIRALETGWSEPDRAVLQTPSEESGVSGVSGVKVE